MCLTMDVSVFAGARRCPPPMDGPIDCGHHRLPHFLPTLRNWPRSLPRHSVPSQTRRVVSYFLPTPRGTNGAIAVPERTQRQHVFAALRGTALQKSVPNDGVAHRSSGSADAPPTGQDDAPGTRLCDARAAGHSKCRRVQRPNRHGFHEHGWPLHHRRGSRLSEPSVCMLPCHCATARVGSVY